MTVTDEPPVVKIGQDCIVVLYSSAKDSRPSEESIHVKDILQIVVERADTGGESVTHCFLKHRTGWTLHFNDQFRGADDVMQKLQSVLGFSMPGLDSIASSGGEGTLVWSAI